MKRLITIFLLLIQLPAFSQLRISSVEKLPLAPNDWSCPVFSPDGKRLYYTTSTYTGVWEYTVATKAVRQVVADPQSGYDFSLSVDGKKIAYRRTVDPVKVIDRVQEIVLKDLATETVQVIARGSNLSTPTFAGGQLVYSENVSTKNIQSLGGEAKPLVLGIEDTKIAVVVNGAKRLLDPLRNGSYIWPVLSPNGKRIAATEMSRGAFLCDTKGTVVTRLGRRNAAVWTRDSKWLVYMNDKDDGHVIVSSDLFAVSTDGKRSKQLTTTINTIELNPQCSPVENKIVCNTLAGEILLMTYEEVKR